MRALTAAVVAATIAVGLVVPARAEPHVRRDEAAFADWLIATSRPGRFDWYGAYGARLQEAGGGSITFGVFIAGRCRREKTRRVVKTICRSRDYVRAKDRDFEMSPVADTATLSTRRKGKKLEAAWTSTPDPGFYSAQEWCFGGNGEEEGEGYGSGIFRPSRATGTMFGRELNRRGWLRFAAMQTGVMVSTCSLRTFDYDPRRDAYTVTYRAPR